MSTSSQAQPVGVFDIGGTWFRSAISRGGELLDRRRTQPAISHVAAPALGTAELQQALLSYLLAEAEDLLRVEPSIRTMSVSLGAALNHHTGEVYESGPLWGSASAQFPLLRALADAGTGLRWLVFNDVTAALAAYVLDADGRPSPGRNKTALITISSGVACRIFDHSTSSFPTDRACGLQGEIGHLPISFRWKEQILDRCCECGGRNHLNAFSSGRGIEQILGLSDTGVPSDLQSFRKALADGDDAARDLLEAVVAPIASAIAWLLTVDPLVETVILTGGTFHSLPGYLDVLRDCLRRQGPYILRDRAPDFPRRVLVAGRATDDSGLLGAARLARPNLAPPAGETLNVRRVYATRPTHYAIEHHECALLRPGSPRIASFAAGSGRCLAFLDSAIERFYAAQLRAYFAHHRIAATCIPLDIPETRKNWSTLADVIAEIESFSPLRRSEPILAFGGGVLLDIVGFAASIFRRGTPYVRIPTTLVALVDAAVGVKTGINGRAAKNRLGSYWPPVGTLMDTSFLQTCDARVLRNGVAEILKMGVICDADLFTRLELHGDRLLANKFQSDEGSELIWRASNAMVDQLEPDLWESELCRVVDFGHTLSPWLEITSQHELLHGEAVSVDVAVFAVIARNRGVLPADEAARILALLQRLGLPAWHEVCRSTNVFDAILETTCHRDGQQRIPLPAGIGACVFVNDLQAGELREALRCLAGRSL